MIIGNQEYTEVASIYSLTEDFPELILNASSGEEGEWTYSVYEESDDIPKYLRAHAKRNEEAEDMDEITKLSRVAETHLNEDTK